MEKQLLGTGLLSWPNYERIAGRYGIIALFRPADVEKGETGLQGLPWNVDTSTLVGKRGSLIAVLDGQAFDLGSGTVFTEQDFGMTYVGLKPEESREEDWLDSLMLYKVDGHLIHKPVELYFQGRDEVLERRFAGVDTLSLEHLLRTNKDNGPYDEYLQAVHDELQERQKF